MNVRHAGGNRSTTPRSRISTSSSLSGQEASRVPTRPTVLEEEEGPDHYSDEETTTEPAVVTPREERAKRRNNRTVEVSQATYVVNTLPVTPSPALPFDHGKEPSALEPVGPAVGGVSATMVVAIVFAVLGALVALWWVASWASAVFSALATVCAWLSAFFQGILSLLAGISPYFSRDHATPDEAAERPGSHHTDYLPDLPHNLSTSPNSSTPINSSLSINVTSDEDLGPLGSVRSVEDDSLHLPSVDQGSVHGSSQPASEVYPADLARMWEEEHAEAQRRFGQRVAEEHVLPASSPSSAGSSERQRCPAVCKDCVQD